MGLDASILVGSLEAKIRGLQLRAWELGGWTVRVEKPEVDRVVVRREEEG